MFNKINDFVDRDTEEKYLEKYAPPVYKQIRNVLGILFVLFFAVTIMAGWNVLSANQRKKSDLYAIDLDTKKVSKMAYSYTPSYSKEKFSYFISSILEGMFSTNFATVDEDMNKYRKYFTKKAWDIFEVQFSGKFAEYLKENSLMANLTITSTPTLVAQKRYISTGKVERIYVLKGFISYKGSIKSKKNIYPVNVAVSLLGVGSNESPYGLSIDSIRIEKP